MEVIKTSHRIHPLIAAAAVAVLLVSLTGVAAITGLLPSSHSTTAPEVASAPASQDTSKTAASPGTHADQAGPASHAQQHKAASSVAQASSQNCASCGKIESVQAVQHQAKPSGLGVVTGAVLGGLLGNQVGNGNGRTVATVAGAVGGGYAGNEVEKRTGATTSYQVRVRMEDGSVRNFPYTTQPTWNEGDRVKVIDGHLTARN